MKKTIPLTQERANNVIKSMSNIKALAKMIQYEHMNECDVNFKSPIIHNHVAQILRSAQAINDATARIVTIKQGSDDEGSEYIGELMVLLNYTIDSMNLPMLKAYNECLKTIKPISA